MDIAQYYVTTLTTAAQKLGPILIFCVVGYFLFIKLPFSFLVKVNKENKPKEAQAPKKEEPANKMRLEQPNYQERLEQARAEKERKQREFEKQKRKENASPAEALFEFEAGETFTQQELKKRYRELLKQNHPDKVASLGADFKKLAEKKTKDINSAYEQLKKKAS